MTVDFAVGASACGPQDAPGHTTWPQAEFVSPTWGRDVLARTADGRQCRVRFQVVAGCPPSRLSSQPRHQSRRRSHPHHIRPGKLRRLRLSARWTTRTEACWSRRGSSSIQQVLDIDRTGGGGGTPTGSSRCSSSPACMQILSIGELHDVELAGPPNFGMWERCMKVPDGMHPARLVLKRASRQLHRPPHVCTTSTHVGTRSTRLTSG